MVCHIFILGIRCSIGECSINILHIIAHRMISCDVFAAAARTQPFRQFVHTYACSISMYKHPYIYLLNSAVAFMLMKFIYVLCTVYPLFLLDFIHFPVFSTASQASIHCVAYKASIWSKTYHKTIATFCVFVKWLSLSVDALKHFIKECCLQWFWPYSFSHLMFANKANILNGIYFRLTTDLFDSVYCWLCSFLVI